MRRSRRSEVKLLLLIVCFLPWFYPGVMGEESFLNGFVAWTKANVDVAAVRQWAATLPGGRTPTTVPYWWHHENRVGAPIPQAEWPPALVRARPDEVRVMEQDGQTCVAISWMDAKPASYPRILLVGTPGSACVKAVDPQLLLQWAQVESGVSAAIHGWP